MQKEEIEQVKKITREIAEEVTAMAIESLREELKAKPQTIKPDISFPKKEVKKDAEL